MTDNIMTNTNNTNIDNSMKLETLALELETRGEQLILAEHNTKHAHNLFQQQFWKQETARLVGVVNKLKAEEMALLHSAKVNVFN